MGACERVRRYFRVTSPSGLWRFHAKWSHRTRLNVPPMKGFAVLLACAIWTPLISYAQCRQFADLTPTVIADDGVTTALLEVHAGVGARSVLLSLFAGLPVAIGEQSACQSNLSSPLFDDGTHGDRVAADGVFTIDGLRWDTRYPTECARPPTFSVRQTSIPGLIAVRLQNIVVDPPITQLFGLRELYVIQKSIIPRTDQISHETADLQATRYVVNLRDDEHRSDSVLGQWPGPADVSPLSRRFYETFGDDYDFLHFVSSAHNACTSRAVGKHLTVQTQWSGTGQVSINNAATFGSNGRLLGINFIEASAFYSPGLASHETLHQWGAQIGATFGLSDSTHHWTFASSVGGVEGGCKWEDNGDGTYTSGGSWSEAGAAANLELYLMGLIAADRVEPIFIATNANQQFCEKGTVIRGPFTEITIDDLQAVHGPRIPGPEAAPEGFAMAYIVTSVGRLLTPLELTAFGRAARLISGSLKAAIEPPSRQPDPSFQDTTSAYMDTEIQAAGECAPSNRVGDCSADNRVTVAELIRGVNIALDRAPLSDCPSLDADESGSATVDELVRAVLAALSDCRTRDGTPFPSTFTPVPSATPTPSTISLAALYFSLAEEDPQQAVNELMQAHARRTDELLDALEGVDGKLATRENITSALTYLQTDDGSGATIGRIERLTSRIIPFWMQQRQVAAGIGGGAQWLRFVDDETALQQRSSQLALDQEQYFLDQLRVWQTFDQYGFFPTFETEDEIRARRTALYQRELALLDQENARLTASLSIFVRALPPQKCPVPRVNCPPPRGGIICGTAIEGSTLSLTCPAGTVGAIDFASYGKPEGVCGDFLVGHCDATGSLAVVSTACVGRSACAIFADYNTFGNPCPFTSPKRLYVQAQCH